MVQIYQQIKHKSGIPLGGIGAGTVEILPDGLFHDWQIFNMGRTHVRELVQQCVESKPPFGRQLLSAPRKNSRNPEPAL